jgi:hypothetical protein
MKKYEPGEPVDSLAKFEFMLKNGLLVFVKNWNKTAHPIILANMQYRIVKRFIDTKQVFVANKKEE